jgi:hypothetical protein
MASSQQNEAVQPTKRSAGQILKSYFYWTYARGSFHYDILVTLILVFLFVTPQLWDYGAKPSPVLSAGHPMQVVANGLGVIVTVQASDVEIPDGASYQQVKKALRKAIEPVMGDAVFVERWETTSDSQGNRVWQVWAHR